MEILLCGISGILEILPSQKSDSDDWTWLSNGCYPYPGLGGAFCHPLRMLDNVCYVIRLLAEQSLPQQ